MISDRVESFSAQIFIAGDYQQAKQLCREFCLSEGLCVTITKTSYVYTGGEERGVIVGLINYPRFPATPEQISETAMRLAEALRGRLSQHSFTVIAGGETIWNSTRNAS